jgi:DNA-binding CsgD family transcriptional regulator
LLESVLEGASGRHRADALRLLGEIRNEDSVFEANELFEEALEHVGDDLELRSGLHLRLAYGHNAVGDWAAAGMHGHHALRLLERLDQPGLLAEALAVVAIADALNGRGVDEAKVERALALEDPNRQVPVAIRPSLIAGCLALYEGRLERSEQLLLPLRRRVAERGEESDLAFVSGNLAWSACWRGDLDAAAAYVEEALESAMRSQSESWRCLSLSYMAVQAAYAGDAELTRTSLAECRALAPRTNMRNALRWAGWAEAVLALSIDDPQTADTALGTLAAPFANARVPEPILVFFLPDEIEALIALGRLDGAEPLLESFAEAAERLQREWARMMAFRCRALLLAASGDLDAAAGAVSEALGLCHGLELRIEVARTLLVAGQLARRQRKKRAAKDYLEQAYGLFERMGARLWAERAAAELGRVGLRPAAPDELTSSERQVAELTASGLKNREVAAQLFRSPKTVEATLARVYRKLEIHSRAELGARLAKGTERERAQT